MALFEDRLTVARPVEVVFDFLTTSANIEKVSADLGLSFVAAPQQYHDGAIIEFQLVVLGQSRKAVHKIVEFERPERFVERQIEGALKLWVHEHIFERDGESTHIIDRITFEPPGGMLGFIATEDRILQSLDNGFFSRNQLIKRMLERNVPHA